MSTATTISSQGTSTSYVVLVALCLCQHCTNMSVTLASIHFNSRLASSCANMQISRSILVCTHTKSCFLTSFCELWQASCGSGAPANATYSNFASDHIIHGPTDVSWLEVRVRVFNNIDIDIDAANALLDKVTLGPFNASGSVNTAYNALQASQVC